MGVSRCFIKPILVLGTDYWMNFTFFSSLIINQEPSPVLTGTLQPQPSPHPRLIWVTSIMTSASGGPGATAQSATAPTSPPPPSSPRMGWAAPPWTRPRPPPLAPCAQASPPSAPLRAHRWPTETTWKSPPSRTPPPPRLTSTVSQESAATSGQPPPPPPPTPPLAATPPRSRSGSTSTRTRWSSPLWPPPLPWLTLRTPQLAAAQESATQAFTSTTGRQPVKVSLSIWMKFVICQILFQIETIFVSVQIFASMLLCFYFSC